MRDVLKLSKLAKIHAKLEKHRMAKRWFKYEHNMRENKPTKVSNPVVRAKSTKTKDAKAAPHQQPEKTAHNKPPNVTIKPELQKPEPDQKVTKRKPTFKSPKQIGVNTISINFGNKGDVQGHFVSDNTSPRGVEFKGKSNATVQKRSKTAGKVAKPEVAVARGRSALSSEESESSSVCRRKRFKRHCCHEIKLTDHIKPEKQPKVPWARNDYQIFSLQNKKKNQKEGALSAKVKDLRRKQFFNFLADFFDKFEAGHMKGKVGAGFKFDDEEKERWLKKYFKKYYMEN